MKIRTVTCVRSREALKTRAAGSVAALGMSIAALTASALSTLEVKTGTSAYSPAPRTETAVLGDVISLSDVVSNTYGNSPEQKSAPENLTKVADTKFDARSGLTTTKTVTPPPGGLLGLFFGAPAALPAPPVSTPMPARKVAYTTMCVRLCDGSYFPVSYATTRSQFGDDQKACDESCDAPSKLFVFETVGGSAETMEDVRGNPYKDLATAFKFRTSYDASCKCRAHPWEQEAQDRHRKYAEAEARGDVATTVQSKKVRREASLETVSLKVDAPVLELKTVGAPTAGTPPIEALSSVKPIPGAAGLEAAAAKPRKVASIGKMQLGMAKPPVAAGKMAGNRVETRQRHQTADDVFRANFGP